jgi:hypothetical protein
VTELKSEEYRALALDCERRARRLDDADARRAYEELARQWRELAEQVDRHRQNQS